MDFTDDDLTFRVVRNDEEQYSLLAVDQDLPRGWRDAGKSGSKQDCLTYIGEVWTDMRPASLRRGTESPTTL